MAHDFIIATGKLTPNKIAREMDRCIAYKHQQFHARGHNTLIIGSFVDWTGEASKPKGVEYFHGYADGVLYTVFGAEQFDGGVSGTGGGAHVPVKLARDQLKKAIQHIIENHPPHRQQALALKDYADNVLAKANGYVTVIYC